MENMSGNILPLKQINYIENNNNPKYNTMNRKRSTYHTALLNSKRCSYFCRSLGYKIEDRSESIKERTLQQSDS